MKESWFSHIFAVTARKKLLKHSCESWKRWVVLMIQRDAFPQSSCMLPSYIKLLFHDLLNCTNAILHTHFCPNSPPFPASLPHKNTFYFISGMSFCKHLCKKQTLHSAKLVATVPELCKLDLQEISIPGLFQIITE